MSAPSFNYTCTNGHEMSGPTEFHECPVYVHGSPCDGQLRRFGAGSVIAARAAKAEAAAARAARTAPVESVIPPERLALAAKD